MLRNSIYYWLKPVLPRSLRLFVRRRFARKIRSQTSALWPVFPGSDQPPQGWSGWPGGFQFAVVLTHDVEGDNGLAKCRELMRREKALGFRSSFNFIPEGEYRVSPELRADLTSDGFEVGIHDLAHNGHLFASAAKFSQNAHQINHYLKEWGACGFRAGFMLRNLDWYHQLNIKYDASTFDTDPFEPQPDGAHTIFPFWVHGQAGGTTEQPGREGYVELPYTLPQDSTLFLIFRETSIDLWKKKVDWVAAHGGMVLLNTHPDYMAMQGKPHPGMEFPVEWYEQLLEYIRTRYAGQYWQALPRDVASFYRDREHPLPAAAQGITAAPPHRLSPKQKIWIDLDNTPHVPLFEPIIKELESRGYSVLLTARDAFQVCDLAKQKGLACHSIGRHHGKNKLRKALGLMHRASQLAGIVLREKPVLAVSHGSRAQLMLARTLRIPSLLIDDYEHSSYPFLMKPDWMLTPEVIPGGTLPVKKDHLRTYPGMKEDVYAWKLQPDPALLTELGLDPADVIVTVRPPATEAHYHHAESDLLFSAFMGRACAAPGVRIVLLPRNQRQREAMETKNPEWFRDGRTVVPPGALDGMNLLWYSDLVVSGGGTMNREAAALGVPVFSLFRGQSGAVDRQLQAEGRLKLITSPEEVSQIPLVHRHRPPVVEATSRRTLLSIVDTIEEIAAATRHAR